MSTIVASDEIKQRGLDAGLPCENLKITARELANREVRKYDVGLPPCFGTPAYNVETLVINPQTGEEIYPCQVCLVNSFCDFYLNFTEPKEVIGTPVSDIVSEYRKVMDKPENEKSVKKVASKKEAKISTPKESTETVVPETSPQTVVPEKSGEKEESPQIVETDAPVTEVVAESTPDRCELVTSLIQRGDVWDRDKLLAEVDKVFPFSLVQTDIAAKNKNAVTSVVAEMKKTGQLKSIEKRGKQWKTFQYQGEVFNEAHSSDSGAED